MTNHPPQPPGDVHRIRLRYPWDVATTPGGNLRLTRRFNRPTGLLPHLTAWLVVEGASGPGTIALNGTPLGNLVPGGPSASISEFHVTPLLQLHNVVVADLAPPTEWNLANVGGNESDRSVVETLLGQVRLEIRGPDAAWVPQPHAPGYEDNEEDEADDESSCSCC